MSYIFKSSLRFYTEQSTILLVENEIVYIRTGGKSLSIPLTKYIGACK